MSNIVNTNGQINLALRIVSGYCHVTIQSKQQYKLTCDLHSVKQQTIFFPMSMIYALAHFTKLEPTIDPVKCHYITAEEITQFHQRSQMISENAWNTLMRIGGIQVISLLGGI